ncbi:MAG: transporter [Pyrinomonadaceae bacterium]|nr:transporter [Pyrinomonadaceae bacterium]
MSQEEFTREVAARWRRTTSHSLWATLIFCALTESAPAQETRLVPNTPTFAAPAAQANPEEEEFIKPSRPGIANPAEIQEAGVLQLEYGYDGNLQREDFRSQQTAPLALRFAATRRLLLEFDLDTVISERTEETAPRMTGVGDTRLGFQIVALEDTESHPALAFAYYVKLPTASEEMGLGTGRVDHRVVALLSKKFGETNLDFNVAYLNVGRETGSGRESGGQVALSVSREFQNNFGFEAELAGQSEDDSQPRGIFALGALTYRANRRLRFDGGLRFGLNPDAPRVGVFAGLTVGVGRLYRRR